MRGSSFPSLLFMVAVVACNIGLVIAEEKTNARLRSQDDEMVSDLHTAPTDAEEDVEPIARSEDEDAERGIWSRLGSWVSRTARKAPKGMIVDEKVAQESISHVDAIMASGKAGKLTKPKVKAIKAYARENPDKWLVMSHYLSYTFGFSFMAYLMYCTFVHGYRPLSMGGPQYTYP